LSKIDSQNKLFSDVNSQLALISGDAAADSALAKPRNYSQSAEERAHVKKELEKWKKEKDQNKRKVNEDKLMKEEMMKKRL